MAGRSLGSSLGRGAVGGLIGGATGGLIEGGIATRQGRDFFSGYKNVPFTKFQSHAISSLRETPSGLPNPRLKQLELVPNSELSVYERLDQQYASVVEGLEGKPYFRGADGPDSFDCSGTVCYGIRKTVGDFGDYSADGLEDFTLPATSNQRGFLYFQNYGNDPIWDHVTTILNDSEILHPSSGSKKLLIVPHDYNKAMTTVIRQIDWKKILE